MTLECNGVFKGGGAKGIAYAGALDACDHWDIDFKAVAGSSAGAITATLVACGYSPTELQDLMPEALRAMESVPRALAKIGGRPSLLSNDALHDFLEQKIAEKVTPQENDSQLTRTFSDIRAETKISLYVVTLDLATRQPRVFSPDLTPHSPVAAAVVASSAIPVAFPASRMVVGNGAVHRLVDGGTWSNYPSFVFLDDDFRSYHGLDSGGTEEEPADTKATLRPTIGFILDDKDVAQPDQHVSPKRKMGVALRSDGGSSTYEFRWAGALMSSALFRWSVGAAPVLLTLLSLRWIQQEVAGPSSLIDSNLPTRLQDPLIALSIVGLAIAGLAAAAAAFVVIRFGRTLFDSGMVGVSAAVGVGPGVAYWAGGVRGGSAQAAPKHIAVRIKVPHALKTLDFNPTPKVREAAVTQGRRATRTTLTGALGDPSKSFPTPDQSSSTLATGGGSQPTDERRSHWHEGRGVRSLAFIYATVAGVFGPSRVLAGFATGSIFMTLLWIAVLGSAVLVGVWLSAHARTREAIRETPYPHLRRLRSPKLLRRFATTAIAFAVILTVPLWLVLEDTSGFRAARLPRLDGTVFSLGADTVPRSEQLAGGEVPTTPDRERREAWMRSENVSQSSIEDIEIVVPGASQLGADDRTFQTLSSDMEGEGWELSDLSSDPVVVWRDGNDLRFQFQESFASLETNGQATIRVDLNRQVAYIEGDLFSELDFALVLLIYLTLPALASRLRRAANWLEQNPTT